MDCSNLVKWNHERRHRQRIRILTFSTLFPNNVQPIHGIFVEQRLRQLIRSTQVSAKVMAPIPWFPVNHRAFGRYALYADVAGREKKNGLEIHHPKFLVIPKIGMTVAPLLLAAGSLRYIKAHALDSNDFDLIDAHYFYPDGVAAIRLGRALGKPVVITGRGTDLSLIPDFAPARRQIVWAAKRAAGIITVTNALKARLVALSVPENRILTLRNGVDLEVFHPVDRDDARRQLGLRRGTILSVGHLIQRKAHDLIIRALAELPDFDLIIVGDGPERSSLSALTGALGLNDRVRFVGQVGQNELPTYYSAVDALVLGSSREGWANVLLESMACGTPVVATDIEGNREVVTRREAGLLVKERTPASLSSGIQAILANPPDRQETRAYAERFSWEATTQGQITLFEQILGRRC